ncbi:septation protein SepH [Arthrobacter silvisoli]|uniref:septation protein SepH n=1 Tax=Arthrobacter silvisoli TaxID=2291022 RepID=UPI000E215410|nr:septation protein SepH [Arthrobacter silvisoli]
MRELRLVGVHDDGGHLLLSGSGGETFRLPIDEALRAAASRTPAQVAARASIAPIAMSPRDIQARIRSGASAAEIAELSGLPLANVQRYEGPVLAEREYIAQQARKVEVASPSPGHDPYRAAFGDAPASLDDMVSHRLSAHGIDPSTVEWDSWRRTDGTWTVVARFEPNPGAPASIGEEPPAMWTFTPGRKTLQNANRWAQQLSELEPLDGPLPTRRLSAVADRPFDFEADADESAGSSGPDADGLLDMLRLRRGQRLGIDEDGDDALALLLSGGVPAAHPRAEEPDTADTDDASSDEADTGRPVARLSLASLNPASLNPASPKPADADRPEQADDGPLHLHDGVSTDTREITVVPAQLRALGNTRGTAKDDDAADASDVAEAAAEGTDELAGEERSESRHRAGLDELLGGASRRQSEEPRRRRAPLSPWNRQASPDAASNKADNAAAKDEEKDAQPAERQHSRPKRSSVPSWDDIVFGTRGD